MQRGRNRSCSRHCSAATVAHSDAHGTNCESVNGGRHQPPALRSVLTDDGRAIITLPNVEDSLLLASTWSRGMGRVRPQAALQHPHHVAVFDAGLVAGEAHLQAEHEDGVSATLAQQQHVLEHAKAELCGIGRKQLKRGRAVVCVRRPPPESYLFAIQCFSTYATKLVARSSVCVHG